VTTSIVRAKAAPDDRDDTIATLQELLEIERARADALKTAIQTARRTGIAVGIVMTRHGVDDDQAFSRLHAASHGVHRALHQVIEAVISGRLTP